MLFLTGNTGTERFRKGGVTDFGCTGSSLAVCGNYKSPTRTFVYLEVPF